MRAINREILEDTIGLVVRCRTREEAENLFVALDELGYTWTDGSELDPRHLNYDYGPDTCYDLSNSKHHVMYCDLGFFEKCGCYTIVECEEMFYDEEEIVPDELLDFLKGYMK